MNYTHLGRSGLHISRLSLGTWNFGTKTDEKEAYRIMDTALDLGINLFDSANHYPDFVNCGLTEEIVGRWFVQGDNRRERVAMATKVYQPMKDPLDGPNDAPGLSKYKIQRHIEGSLRRLQTDHVELYQMHHIDRRTSWEETWEAFELLSAQGKICYAGSSNFPAWQLAVAQAAAGKRNFLGLVSEQHKVSLLCRLPELEVLPAAEALGIGILVYSPLSGSLLAGKTQDAEPGSRSEAVREAADGIRGQLDAFSALCKELGENEATVALAWVLAKPAVSSIILGPRTVQQLEESMRALEIELDADTVTKLDTIFPGPGGPAPEAYAW